MKKGEITQCSKSVFSSKSNLFTNDFCYLWRENSNIFFGKILFFEVLFFFHKIYSRKFRICWLIREQYFVIANYSDDKAPQGH